MCFKREEFSLGPDEISIWLRCRVDRCWCIFIYRRDIQALCNGESSRNGLVVVQKGVCNVSIFWTGQLVSVSDWMDSIVHHLYSARISRASVRIRYMACFPVQMMNERRENLLDSGVGRITPRQCAACCSTSWRFVASPYFTWTYGVSPNAIDVTQINVACCEPTKPWPRKPSGYGAFHEEITI
jgi:hypothetical protein